MPMLWSPQSLQLPFTPFLFFDGLFLDRVERVEADERLDVVPGGDAFRGAEASKIAGRFQLLERFLVEVKADQQLQQSVERHLVTHIGELGRSRDRTVVAVAAADDIDQRDL